MARQQIHIDADELRQLEVDFRGAPGRIQRSTRGTMNRKVGPLVAKEMRADASGHRYLPKLADAVSHEMVDDYTLEVGLAPKRRTQGALAHIIVYGSVNNQPVYDHMAGPRRAMPLVERMLGDDAEDAVLGVDT